MRWDLHAETAKINVSVEIHEIQCFQTPHTPTFGAMTFMNLVVHEQIQFLVPLCGTNPDGYFFKDYSP